MFIFFPSKLEMHVSPFVREWRYNKCHNSISNIRDINMTMLYCNWNQIKKFLLYLPDKQYQMFLKLNTRYKFLNLSLDSNCRGTWKNQPYFALHPFLPYFNIPELPSYIIIQSWHLDFAQDKVTHKVKYLAISILFVIIICRHLLYYTYSLKGIYTLKIWHYLKECWRRWHFVPNLNNVIPSYQDYLEQFW